MQTTRLTPKPFLFVLHLGFQSVPSSTYHPPPSHHNCLCFASLRAKSSFTAPPLSDPALPLHLAPLQATDSPRFLREPTCLSRCRLCRSLSLKVTASAAHSIVNRNEVACNPLRSRPKPPTRTITPCLLRLRSRDNSSRNSNPDLARRGAILRYRTGPQDHGWHCMIGKTDNG